MALNKNFFALTYLVLLSISIYTPRFGVLDKMAIQYFLISIVNIYAIIGLLVLYKKDFISKPFKHPLVLVSMGYVAIAALSMIKSINVVESLVELSHLVTISITIVLLIFLTYERLIKTNHILIILLITLIIDIFFSLGQYIPYVINNIPYSIEDNWRLVGLYGNRNITATTIAFRIPLIILLAFRLKNNYLHFLVLSISTVGFFNILLLSSRAAYLSIIICILICLVVSIYKYFRDNRNILFVNRYILLLYILPSIIAYFMSIKAIDPGAQGGNVADRISTISSTNDSSKNTRLRYYMQSLTHISKNPLLGAGIGNWKILSIKYDSKNIVNYVIPYNAHNDILEATAETGIFGGILFLSFFLIILYYLFELLRKNILSHDDYLPSVLLILTFVVYFIDLNLNFPSSRPANQFFLLMFMCLVLNYKEEINEKK